jgi:hypothetical protein
MKTTTTTITAHQVLDVLNDLTEQYNDHQITEILATALGTHLHACQDGAMAETCMNYMAHSFNDLFMGLHPKGTITEASNALH